MEHLESFGKLHDLADLVHGAAFVRLGVDDLLILRGRGQMAQERTPVGEMREVAMDAEQHRTVPKYDVFAITAVGDCKLFTIVPGRVLDGALAGKALRG